MPVQCTCPVCGTAFSRDRSRVKVGNNYCSNHCAGLWRKGPPEPPVLSEDGTFARIPLRSRSGELRAYAVVDADDATLVCRYRWSFDHGYAKRREIGPDGRSYVIYLHRLLLGLTTGDGLEVDHIDRNRLNCRRSNMRVVTHAGNLQNHPGFAGGTSRFRGVCWSTKRLKWIAQVRVNGHSKYIGQFDSETEAAEAARAARMELMPYAVD